MADCKYTLSDFTINKNPLGEGGFGKVYRAPRNSDEVEVCLKQIPLDKLSKRELELEAKILSESNYKHVIGYYGSFIESGNFYIVMEYAAEGSLRTMIRVCYCASIIWLWIDTLETYTARPSLY